MGGGAQAELDARMWTTDGRAARGDAHSNSLGAQLKRLQDKRQSEFQSDDASQQAARAGVSAAARQTSSGARTARRSPPSSADYAAGVYSFCMNSSACSMPQ